MTETKLKQLSLENRIAYLSSKIAVGSNAAIVAKLKRRLNNLLANQEA